MYSKKIMIVSIITIISALFGILNMLLLKEIQRLSILDSPYILFLLSGIIAGIYMILKEKTGFLLGMLYYALQIIIFCTKDLCFNFSSGIVFTIGFGNTHMDNSLFSLFQINIFALIMFFVVLFLFFDVKPKTNFFHKE
ncbi:MAG: hypothetical protein P8Y49_09335 [Sulfurovaceae bacterium]